jgi:hypothetical protein
MIIYILHLPVINCSPFLQFLLLVFALCALRVAAQSSTAPCTTLLSQHFTAPTGISELDITYPPSLPFNVTFYQATTGDLQVDAEWCSSDATLTAILKALVGNITNAVDNVLVKFGLV